MAVTFLVIFPLTQVIEDVLGIETFGVGVATVLVVDGSFGNLSSPNLKSARSDSIWFTESVFFIFTLIEFAE